MENFKKTKDSLFNPIPIDRRQKWYVPAIIFGGLEFCIPVLLVGGILIGNFGIIEIIGILLVGLVFFQWLGNAVVGYIGAKTGLTSSTLSVFSFGKEQSRIIVSSIIIILTLGWWAIQTSVASDALSALLGINKNDNFLFYIFITTIVGLLFAVPSILGYNSIKWVDYIAIPAGLLLAIVALYLSIKNLGWQNIYDWNPNGEMSITEGVNLVISINVAQWLIAPDYTRFAKPNWKDNILIPLGIIIVGFPLFIVGAIMSIGTGNADIVKVMQDLGFPAWGFIILWIATWTSQLIGNYTGGLALCNLFNDQKDTSRKKFTILFAILGIVLSLIGIMDQFVNFLYLIALIIPAISGVIICQYFFIHSKKNSEKKSWNWLATISIVFGFLIGYLTQYIHSFGLPSIQSLIVSGGVYFILNEFYKGRS